MQTGEYSMCHFQTIGFVAKVDSSDFLPKKKKKNKLYKINKYIKKCSSQSVKLKSNKKRYTFFKFNVCTSFWIH